MRISMHQVNKSRDLHRDALLQIFVLARFGGSNRMICVPFTNFIFYLPSNNIEANRSYLSLQSLFDILGHFVGLLIRIVASDSLPSLSDDKLSSKGAQKIL